MVKATNYNITKCLRFAVVNTEQVMAHKLSIGMLEEIHLLPPSAQIALKLFYIFMEDPQGFIGNFFKGWKDTATYLIEDPPKYHKEESCPLLLSDFWGIAIPEIIKDRGLVNEARSFTRSNASMYSKDTVLKFAEKFVMHFAENHNIEVSLESLVGKDKSNSGVGFADESLDSIIETIKALVADFNNSHNHSIEKLSRSPHRNRWYKTNQPETTDPISQQIFEKFSKTLKDANVLANRLQTELQKYAVIYYGRNEGYDINVLKELKFEACKGCS